MDMSTSCCFHNIISL